MKWPGTKSRKLLDARRTLLLLVGLAFALRTIAALTRSMIQLDETAYVRMAENLLAGEGPLDISGIGETHFSPLLSLYIAGAATIFKNFIFSSYLTVITFGSLLIIPVYMLGKDLASERTGLMAAALMAVMPIFVDYSSKIYSESAYIFFLLFSIAFGWRMIKSRRALAGALCGVSLGLAYLSNPSTVFYLVTFSLLLLVLLRKARLQYLKTLGAFLLCFTLFGAPYVLFLHSEVSRWTYSGKNINGMVYAATNNLRHGTLEWEKDVLSLTGDGQLRVMTVIEENHEPAGMFTKNPLKFGKNFLHQSFIFYNQELPYVVPLWLLPIMGLGLFGSTWDREKVFRFGYISLMMVPAQLIMVMYAHNRLFMPFVPLVMIFVAEGWGMIQDRLASVSSVHLRGERMQKFAAGFASSVVLFPLTLFSGFVVSSQSYSLNFREAGEWLRGAAREDKRIMSREFSAAFYAGADTVFLPYADYDAMTMYARRQNVDYLVTTRKDILQWRPQQTRLLAGQDTHPEWTLLYSTGTNGDETMVFALQK